MRLFSRFGLRLPFPLTTASENRPDSCQNLAGNRLTPTFNPPLNLPSTTFDGLWLMGLPDALCRIPAAFFRSYPEDAEIALRMLRDPGPLLRILLTGSNVVVAGRLAGAYAFLGEPIIAERIRKTMETAGQSIQTVNPFEREEPLLGRHPRVTSPHAARRTADGGRRTADGGRLSCPGGGAVRGGCLQLALHWRIPGHSRSDPPGARRRLAAGRLSFRQPRG